MAYSAGDTLARVIMSNVTGLVADQVVNDFAFSHAGGVPTTLQRQALLDDLTGFYNDTQASGDYVAQFISTSIDRSVTHEVNFYNIVAGPLGPPAQIEPWLGPAAAVGATNLPNEVAGVVSFHADLTGVYEEVGATRPRARRRGRLFIGPLGGNAVETGVPNPTLQPDFTQCLREAVIKLASDAAADGFTLSVWSRADAVLREAVAGWTDDAPDTQRRRGQAPVSRTVYFI